VQLSPTYPLETERLLLRPLTPADAEAVHAFQSLPEVCRYVPYSPRTLDEVRANLADPGRARTELTGEGQVLDLAVTLKETGQVVGDALLFFHSEVHRSGEVGYALHPDHHGRGYATEAAAAMLSLGFAGLGLHRIIARIDQRNAASAAVLTRLGMRQEAVLVDNAWFKGEWSTEVDFAILDHEWRAGLASQP
jgi:RimJ/RimL family protein N-acetyltransferase